MITVLPDIKWRAGNSYWGGRQRHADDCQVGTRVQGNGTRPYSAAGAGEQACAVAAIDHVACCHPTFAAECESGAAAVALGACLDRERGIGGGRGGQNSRRRRERWRSSQGVPCRRTRVDQAAIVPERTQRADKHDGQPDQDPDRSVVQAHGLAGHRSRVDRGDRQLNRGEQNRRRSLTGFDPLPQIPQYSLDEE